MSPRSPRRSKQSKGVGAKAPSLRSRLALVESYLRTVPRPVSESELQQAPTNPGMGKSSPPPIKPRIEGLLSNIAQLNSNLDSLSHVISGDGGPAPTTAGNTAAQPYAIPDQISVLEESLRTALSRVASIIDRF